DSARVILDLRHSIYNYPDKVLWSQIRVENDTLILGYRQTKGWAPNRYIFFAIRFSKPIRSYGLKNYAPLEYRGFGKRASTVINYPEMAGKQLRGWFNFDLNPGDELLVKVGISAVDMNGALNNLDHEIPGWDFDRVKAVARDRWNHELGKVNVEGAEKEKTIFYTSLYHLMLAPVIYTDQDGRYRGADQAIHQANGFTNYTIYSLWDTYRATHPLFTILEPERVGDMITSMIRHRQQNVHKILPVWSFHAHETWCMIGYHSVSVIADAYLKGIRNFDAGAAFDAMLASSTYAPYAGLGAYMKYGFVPADIEPEGASKTLEYGYDDWCIAQMAHALKKNQKTEDIYQRYMERAKGFEKIFDPATGFMRARKTDGTFRTPFDPLHAQYGGDYTEGNAWQYSWYVPQDVARLIELLGGDKTFIHRLDTLFVIQTDEDQFRQVEDIAGLIGQYAHGNEPSQHIAYLYNYAGASWKTQEKIHLIMNHLFDDTPYGICGNEDCGQMSAWYLFSSMGFYPVCPGSLEYVIGTPKLPRIELHLSGHKTFTITAHNLSDRNFYIQSVTLNGEPLTRSYIKHNEIMKGGELIFEMGPTPNKQWAGNRDARPYSMSAYK
ncbi:MAG: GH92 family glycosyl hydrolase, partial [Bacteroidales bacterium]|nr:GH92 family glycosyl hydrolase [Bacteroidales bacterium]